IPWKDIVISGHVVSDSKEKISKSKGSSAILPENLLSQYSADAIRFWTASGTLGHDVAFSENQLKIGQKLVTKLWNAFIFISQHFPKTAPSKEKPKKLSATNEWILHKSSLCYLAYAENLNKKHEFSLALDQVEKFFWHDFCDNYLEFIKDQLFNPDRYAAEEIEATRWTLYQVGLRILQFYAPYLPYITEIIYCSLYKEHEKISSVHQTKFDDIQKIYSFPDSAHRMNIIIDLVRQVRKLKSENQLSLKTEIKTVTISGVDELTRAIIIEQEKILKGIIHAQNIRYSIEPVEITQLEKHEQHLDATIKL
ncbi:MAG TPA: class I tRNA ligase family protein, partial [Candidatus Babeliales bacterium]|nr:class I tRNA ligase family protein [Candidatus Babeliales bacterium]